MSSIFNVSAVDRGPRYRNEDAQKTTGATYTPFGFATFVAQQMLQVAELPKRGPIRVLDPAAGDGHCWTLLLGACQLTSVIASRYGGMTPTLRPSALPQQLFYMARPLLMQMTSVSDGPEDFPNCLELSLHH